MVIGVRDKLCHGRHAVRGARCEVRAERVEKQMGLDDSRRSGLLHDAQDYRYLSLGRTRRTEARTSTRTLTRMTIWDQGEGGVVVL